MREEGAEIEMHHSGRRRRLLAYLLGQLVLLLSKDGTLIAERSAGRRTCSIAKAGILLQKASGSTSYAMGGALLASVDSERDTAEEHSIHFMTAHDIRITRKKERLIVNEKNNINYVLGVA